MKVYLLISLFLLLVFSLSLTSGLNSSERTEFLQCRADCRAIHQNTTDSCKEDFTACKDSCTNSSCLRACAREKANCSKTAASSYRLCQKGCMPEKTNNKPSCKSGNLTYSAGEKFTQGCNACSCNEHGKIKCTRDSFCNMNVSITKEACENSNGLYQPLCIGPYFGVLCMSEKYCLCDGLKDYSCPEGYDCIKNFVSSFKQKSSLHGWRNLLGQPLGDIGVCGVN